VNVPNLISLFDPLTRLRESRFPSIAAWCLLIVCMTPVGHANPLREEESSESPASTVKAADTASTTLDQAVAAYEKAMEANGRDIRISQFSRAEQLFRQVIESKASAQRPSADLYVNLGNAALQAEHFGVALAAFRQALELAPNHQRAAQNLNYARSVLPDWSQPDVEQVRIFRSLNALQ
jgi:tetratricopeptide (TPR) repeat protein